ncbi:hypothetical protein Hanom_Chr12g01118931 [Helianthus anomalus]
MKDLLEFQKTLTVSAKIKGLLHAIILTTCWMIWKARNDVIFNGKRVSIGKIVGDVQNSTFLWINNKAKNYAVEWNKWLNFDVF